MAPEALARTAREIAGIAGIVLQWRRWGGCIEGKQGTRVLSIPGRENDGNLLAREAPLV